MRTRFLFAISAAALAALALGGIVLATPASMVTTTQIATGTLSPVNVSVKTGDWKLDLTPPSAVPAALDLAVVP